MAAITPVSDDRGERIELYDSGATRHISPYKSNFTSYTVLDPPVYLNVANQQRFPAVGTGTLAIHAPNGSTSSPITLTDILHVPAVGYTLVSHRALDKKGYCASIGGGNLKLFALGGKRVAHIPQSTHSLYHTTHLGESAHAVETISVMELHRCMGHITPASAHALVEKNLVTGIKLDPDSQEAQCNACIFVHTTRKPVLKMHVSPQVQRFGEEVHMDVWGPSPVTSKCRCCYFITFTDDATRYTVTYLLCTKVEALGAYKAFEAWALAQQHCMAIKVLQSDCGGEYLSKAFDQHLKSASTARHLTVHNTPQLNGVAEWLNCTLVEHIQAFTHSSGLPKFLWGKALWHMTWLKNQTATQALDGLTPHQVLFRCAPDLSGLQQWGATVWVHDADSSKLDVHVQEGRWLGFNTESHAHQVYFLATRNIMAKENIYFSTALQLKGEEIFIPGTEREQRAVRPASSTTSPPPTLPPIQTLALKAPTPTSPLSPLTPLSDTSHALASTGVEGDDEADPGRTPLLTHTRKLSCTLHKLMEGVGVSSTCRSNLSIALGLQLLGGFDNEEAKEAGGVWSAESAFNELEDLEWLKHILAAETVEVEVLEPCSLAKAKRCPDWPLWEKAISEELTTLKTASTWRLEEAPPGANVIGLKWVFKAKKDAAGNIARYKAQLVTQGFSQISGVDYDNTYTPVVKLASSHAIIMMANHLRLVLHQVDIKGTYLNRVLRDDEILYMKQPPGYAAPGSGM